MRKVKVIEHSAGKGQAKLENGEWWFRYLEDCKYDTWSEWQKDLAPLTSEWVAIKRKVSDNESISKG
jgi:hypothetical protein